MTFSVDYDYSDRINDEDIRYFLVILPTKGEPIIQEVTLQQSGTVEATVPGLAPDAGPFKARVDFQQPKEPRPDHLAGPVQLTAA